MPERLLVIPAAGRGSRLGSALPKALVPVGGRPMLDHLLALYAPWVGTVVVIASPALAERLRQEHHAPPLTVAVQASPTGMLDAILLAAPAVRASAAEWVWITWVDQIAVRPETVAALADAEATGSPAIALPVLERARPYTHLDRDPSGRITAIRQRREGDAMPDAGESEIGVFALARNAYLEDLPRFAEEGQRGRGHSTGERNFLPFIPWIAARRQVVTVPAREDIEAVGINTPEELAQVEAVLRERMRAS